REALRDALRPDAESAGRRAALSAIPLGERGGELQLPGARWLAPGHLPDTAAAVAAHALRVALARLSRDGARSPLPDRARDGEPRAAALSAATRLRLHLGLWRGLGALRRAARRGGALVRGRCGGPSRPARGGALPRAAPRGRHGAARQALDARAGDRLWHRPERGRALRGVSGAGLLVQARAAQDPGTARARATRARQPLLAEGVPPRGARYRHRAARAPRARSRRLHRNREINPARPWRAGRRSGGCGSRDRPARSAPASAGWRTPRALSQARGGARR